jgi:hypothetical protein
MGKVIAAITGLLLLGGCDSSMQTNAGAGPSLWAAEEFSVRLRSECDQVGYVVAYRGSLGYVRTKGLQPAYEAGQWDVFLWKTRSKEGLATELMREEDVASLQVVRSAGCDEKVAIVRINGEPMHFRIKGQSLDWQLPGTQITVAGLLELCSDRPAPPVE